ncbi:hypothetical protein DIPPA_14804 [Diplonema papillatum]|nr:hypothetical protein DIPPA_14804 [Diplonema papillatum]
MGNCCEHSAFGPQTLADKEKELYLGANAIKSLYRVFVQYSLATDTMGIPGTIDDKDLPQERHAHDPRVWRGSLDGGTMLLRQQQFLCMPWFRKNPFAPRVFECFKDAGEYMTFEAFVTLASSLSPKTPASIKRYVAFRLFDFDNDGAVRMCDIETMLQVVTGYTDLWSRAAEVSLFEPPAGPLVTPGWPKGSFPQRCIDGAPPLDLIKTEGGTASLREACTAISRKVFNTVDVDGCGEIGLAEFENVLNRVPDLQVLYSFHFN